MTEAIYVDIDIKLYFSSFKKYYII